jgi:hypothetical protein
VEDLAISNHDEPVTRARSGRSILVPSCFLLTKNVKQSEWKEGVTDTATTSEFLIVFRLLACGALNEIEASLVAA